MAGQPQDKCYICCLGLQIVSNMLLQTIQNGFWSAKSVFYENFRDYRHGNCKKIHRVHICEIVLIFRILLENRVGRYICFDYVRIFLILVVSCNILDYSPYNAIYFSRADTRFVFFSSSSSADEVVVPLQVWSLLFISNQQPHIFFVYLHTGWRSVLQKPVLHFWSAKLIVFLLSL